MVILNSMWAQTGGQSRSYLNGGAQCKYEGSWACVCVPATFFYSFLPSSLPLSYTHANTQIYIHSPTRKKSLERGEIISHKFSTKNLTLQIKAIRVRKKDGEIQGGGDIEDGGKKKKNRTAVSVPSKIASKKNWLSRLSSAEIPFVQVRWAWNSWSCFNALHVLFVILERWKHVKIFFYRVLLNILFWVHNALLPTRLLNKLLT